MATNSKRENLFDTQAGVRLAAGGASVNESPETARVADVASHPLNAEHRRPVWLTAREAAQYLSVEPRTVLLWARQGKLRGFKLSGTKRHVWRFRHCDLDAMLTGPSVALRTKGAQ